MWGVGLVRWDAATAGRRCQLPMLPLSLVPSWANRLHRATGPRGSAAVQHHKAQGPQLLTHKDAQGHEEQVGDAVLQAVEWGCGWGVGGWGGGTAGVGDSRVNEVHRGGTVRLQTCAATACLSWQACRFAGHACMYSPPASHHPAAAHPMHTNAETGPRQAMNLPPKELAPRHCHTARHTNQLAQMALRKVCRVGVGGWVGVQAKAMLSGDGHERHGPATPQCNSAWFSPQHSAAQHHTPPCTHLLEGRGGLVERHCLGALAQLGQQASVGEDGQHECAAQDVAAVRADLKEDESERARSRCQEVAQGWDMRSCMSASHSPTCDECCTGVIPCPAPSTPHPLHPAPPSSPSSSALG